MTVLNNADQMFSGSEQVMGVYQGSDFLWGPFNSATGGTEATVTNYNGSGEIWKTHTFTSGGSLNVTFAPGVFPFRVLVVGGGGSGGTGCPNGSGGGGGGGGVYYTPSQTIGVSSVAVTVGSDAYSNADYHPAGPNGGTSAFGDITAGGGGGGGTGAWNGKKPQGGGANGTTGTHANGGKGGSGSTDHAAPGQGQGGEPAHAVTGGQVIDITGAAVHYGSGGNGPDGPGHGGNTNPPAGTPTAKRSKAGIVIVAYRIG